jgi:hypothetical protein
MSRLTSEKADAINLAGVHIYSFAHGFAESRIFPRSKPSFKNGPTKCRQADLRNVLWVESSSRAPAIVYCASVSPNVRCVSANVRQTAASVSDNLRWNWHSIAHRTVHYCASLHLPPFFRIQRTSDARQARAATDATAMPNRPTTSRASRASRDRQPNS